MPVKPCAVRTDPRQHEIDNHGTPMFPCGGYSVRVGERVTESIPWHWHEEIEVLFVAGGTLRLEVPRQTLVVQAGEAAFLNASVLHSAVSAGEGGCELHSFVFDPGLISGSLESAIEQKYVRPLLRCPQLSALRFQGEPDWHGEIARCIETAFTHYREESFGYELLVRDMLSRLLFLIVSHHRDTLRQHRDAQNTQAVRVKEMLGYIHAQYAQPVGLGDIAAAAAVSERECLRCFHTVLGTTPMRYLLRHRVSVAAGLLLGADHSVTEICKLTGFESPSYFSLKFRSLTGMTPREYRQRGK